MPRALSPPEQAGPRKNPVPSTAEAPQLLALLYRAVTGNEDAWCDYYAQVNGLVLKWISRLTTALDRHEREAVANDAWGRFARHLTADLLTRFASYGQVMQYLKCCTRSAAIDALRRRQERLSREVSLEAQGPDEDNRAGISGEQQAILALWEAEIKGTVLAALRTEEERHLASMIFFEGYHPREVLARYPHRYPHAEAVYQAIRSLRERLQHYPPLRRLVDR